MPAAVHLSGNADNGSGALAAVPASQKKDEEMVALESQLSSSIRLQIENIRAGITQMDIMSAQTLPRALPAQLSSIAQLCDQTDAMIANYSFIKLVSRTHASFQKTRAIYEQFRVLDEQIERVHSLLEIDQQTGALENVLLIYCRLAQLSAFRNETMDMVKDAPSSLVYTLKRYFKKLDDLTEAFDAYFWSQPKQLETLLAEGKRTDIVRIAQVLSHMEESSRSRFFGLVEEQVTAKFAPMLNAATGPNAMDSVLEDLEFYEHDLLQVRDELTSRFPTSFGILDFYLLTYHRNIHSVLGRLLNLGSGKRAATAAAPLTAGQILVLLGWIRSYQEFLLTQLGVAIDELEPHLLDGRETVLIAEYVKQSRGKIIEWINNLLNSEKKAFLQRSGPPDADAENRYFTPATVDLFQIVKQHVDMAAGVSNGRLLADIVSESVQAVSNFQSGLIKVIEAEALRVNEKPESTAAYFEDFVIMMGNSCLRWIENMQGLAESLTDRLAPEFLSAAQKQLKTCSDGFLNVAKTTTKVLVDTVVGAVKQPFSQLFALDWYEDPVVETIVATFEDFFSDYQQHAEDFLMTKLVVDVLERTVILYIEAMRGKAARLKMQAAPERLELDVSTLRRFFVAFRDAGKVDKALDPLIKLRTLLVASKQMILLEFFAFLKAYPDAPVTLIEELLGKRDDLDKASLRELMDSVRAKLNEEKLTETSQSSVFSKLRPSLAK
jgi:exocyst complex component 3